MHLLKYRTIEKKILATVFLTISRMIIFLCPGFKYIEKKFVESESLMNEEGELSRIYQTILGTKGERVE